jgi:GT2 family glycosyltransferase
VVEKCDAVLSIVIVTWNSAKDIEACLNSVYAALLPHPPEVYVVDNASSDSTVEHIKRSFPTVKLIESQTNLGFARANNLAISQCRGRHILLLNPDTIVEPEALATLSDYLDKHQGVAVVGPRLVTDTGELQPSCLRYVSLPALLTGFIGQGSYAPQQRSGPTQVEAVSGAALMTRREAIEQVGLLDERFFMYGEETDWCYRMAQASWKIHYCPSATVTHMGGQSANQIPVDTYIRRRRAQLQFMRKHRSSWEARIAGHFMRINVWLHEQRASGAQKGYYQAIRARLREEGLS